jgi:hypothetical protein
MLGTLIRAGNESRTTITFTSPSDLVAFFMRVVVT